MVAFRWALQANPPCRSLRALDYDMVRPMRMTVLSGLLALAAAGSGLVAAGCDRQPASNAAQNAPAEELPLPRLPAADPPLDRAALLLAVASAASAVALGKADAMAQRELDGDRFELRIRFGCPGVTPVAEQGSFNARFDAANRTLRLRAAPDLRIDDPWITTLAGDTAEAVEGFWLRRPWLLDSGCPANAASSSQAGQSPTPRSNEAETAKAASAGRDEPPPAIASGPRIGIAQFFTDMDARTGRRGDRAYEATKVLAAGEHPSSQGYDLVLSGRLARLPDGRVIACRARSADVPPDCIVSVDIDRVRIDRPDTSGVLAEWST